MDEINLLVPIMIIAFFGLVILATYFERMLEKKRKEYLRNQKLNLELTHKNFLDEFNEIANGESEDKQKLKKQLSHQDMSNESKTNIPFPKKLSALEQVNV